MLGPTSFMRRWPASRVLARQKLESPPPPPPPLTLLDSRDADLLAPNPSDCYLGRRDHDLHLERGSCGVEKGCARGWKA